MWTRLIPLGNSLWNDEIHSVQSYILGGPSGIWGSYTPNDHMLFELLGWMTVKLLNYSSEQTYRIWSVLPAIAAVSVLIAWSWRRLGAWVAAMFAVLAATAPLVMTLSIQARGYGLGFLASTLVLIAADELGRARSRRALWCFGGGSLLGILTLPTFVVPVLVTAALLLIVRPTLRRPLVIAVAIIGAVSLVFYAPVLGAAVSSAGSLTSSPLPWQGFVTQPLVDLLAPSVQLLVAPLSLAAAEVVGACVVGLGVIALLSDREGLLATLLILPTPITYLVFEILRLTSADRFMSFLMLPLLLLAAVALVRGTRLIADRSPTLGVVALAAGIGFSVFVLRRGEVNFIYVDKPPIEDWREAASLSSGERVVITNSYYANDLEYYLGSPIRQVLDPVRLERLICGFPGAFAYVDHNRAPSPEVSTSCLVQRHAAMYQMNQLRGAMTVWLVPPKEPLIPTLSPTP